MQRAWFVIAASMIYLASGFGQNVNIHFAVNMNQRIEQGVFNANSNFVDIAGSFNGWNGSGHHLSDNNEDGIYDIVIGGFLNGETIEFKFRIDGKWDGREEFPNGGPNRSYTVSSGENNILVWYNNEIPAGEGFQIDFGASTSDLLSGGIVQFNNLTAGNFQSVEWHFEGGQPSSSTEHQPLIKYQQSGSFDVVLIVSDEVSTDTLQKVGFINVEERIYSDISWWNETIFYEVFVRSFQDSDGDGIGDIQGIIDRLDYLNDGDPETSSDLGINGIWLMPINPSPSYHGYDVTEYEDVNSDYGDLDDFRRLIDEAHKRGIKIIIDFVMNHSSRDHPWFAESSQSISSTKRNWYRWKSQRPSQTGPWGQNVWHQHPTGFYYGLFWEGMPDLNYAEPQVQEMMFEAANFWLNDVGIDGFRLDAVKYILEEDPVLEDSDATLKFWKDYQSRIKSYEPDAFSVGEAWTSTNKVLMYVEDNGLDMCFEFDLANAILSSVNNQNAIDVNMQVQKAYNLYPHLQFGTFLTNHDMNRVVEVLQGSVAKNKTAAAMYLTLPGTPFIYYGEEIGMRGVKPDEFIRKPMQWNSSYASGFTTGNPWISINSDYPTLNLASQQSQGTSLWNHYQKIIKIRNETTALRTGDYLPILINDNRAMGFIRQTPDSRVVVLINLSDGDLNNLVLDLSFTELDPGEHATIDLMDNKDHKIEIDMSQMSSFTLKGRQVSILKFLQSTPVFDTKLSLPILEIIPNPALQQIQVSLSDLSFDETHFIIVDILGRICHSGSLGSNGSITIDQLKDGIYVLQIISDHGIQSAKFIKKK